MPLAASVARSYPVRAFAGRKAPQRTHLPRRAFLEWAALAVLLCTLAVALGSMVGLGRLDLVLYDAAQSLRSRPAPEDIAIVAIDDESIAAVGRWPWRRAVLATLLHRIAATQPRAIGVDVLLSELDDRDARGDAVLAGVLKSIPGIVLPVVVQTRSGGAGNTGKASDSGSAPLALYPAKPFLDAGVRLAHAQVETDADGTVRSLYLREGYADAQWPAFSVAVGAPALEGKPLPGVRRLPGEAQADHWVRDHWVHIDFAGPPGTILRIPAIKLLTGAPESKSLAGKFVFVGSTATGLGDAYPTPLTGLSELMPGVEVHAQALNALLRGRATAHASPAANAMFTLVPVLIALIGFVLFSPRLVLLLVFALLGATFIASAALLAQAQLWFPPAAAAMLLIVAYPLWSWRRLEAVMRFLGNQFEQMEREPLVVPELPRMPRGRFSDVLDRQIRAVRDAADRLREARRFIAASVDSLPVATLVAGGDERVLIANRLVERLFEGEAGAAGSNVLRGRALADMFQRLAPDRPSLWDDARRSLEAGGRAKLEFKDAGGRSLLLEGATSLGSNGATVGVLLTLVDLSAIRQAQRKRDEALAFLSHDIRSPQASIIAELELHGLDPLAFPASRTMEQIERHARHTIDLADQFVQISRVESEPYRMAPCDLAEVAREAVDSIRTQAEAKSIRMEFESGEAAPVRGDRRLLGRGIVNLANNAVKYSPAGSRVTVTVATISGAQGAQVRCEVRDQGYGISEKDQQRLFERFARFSTPGQPQEKGIGLGLAFVKTVIERHDGRMTVSSVPGAGSTFGFVLPRAADEVRVTQAGVDKAGVMEVHDDLKIAQ
ncbi:MAG: CHASE2 domain-containing protein [Betaproteobacteria bacterium]|nr:CHASE2 domain-containing protein [Betaproteobacteria bacterium]